MHNDMPTLLGRTFSIYRWLRSTFSVCIVSRIVGICGGSGNHWIDQLGKRRLGTKSIIIRRLKANEPNSFCRSWGIVTWFWGMFLRAVGCGHCIEFNKRLIHAGKQVWPSLNEFRVLTIRLVSNRPEAACSLTAIKCLIPASSISFGILSRLPLKSSLRVTILSSAVPRMASVVTVEILSIIRPAINNVRLPVIFFVCPIRCARCSNGNESQNWI